MNNRRNWNDNQLIEAINSYTTMADVLRHIGLVVCSGNYNTIKLRAKKLNIDISHLIGHHKNPNSYNKICDEDLFVIDSNISGKLVRYRILSKKLIEYKCSECGLTGNWNGEKNNITIRSYEWYI